MSGDAKIYIICGVIAIIIAYTLGYADGFRQSAKIEQIKQHENVNR